MVSILCKVEIVPNTTVCVSVRLLIISFFISNSFGRKEILSYSDSKYSSLRWFKLLVLFICSQKEVNLALIIEISQLT